MQNAAVPSPAAAAAAAAAAANPLDAVQAFLGAADAPAANDNPLAPAAAWNDALPTSVIHGDGTCPCLTRLATLRRDVFDRVSTAREGFRCPAASAGQVPERQRSVGSHNQGGGKCSKVVKSSSASSARARPAKPSRPTRTPPHEAFVRRSLKELRAPGMHQLCWKGATKLVGVSSRTVYAPLERYKGRALVDVLGLRTLPRGVASRAARSLVPLSELATHRCCSRGCLASVARDCQVAGGAAAHFEAVWAEYCAPATAEDSRGAWQRQSDTLRNLLWLDWAGCVSSICDHAVAAWLGCAPGRAAAMRTVLSLKGPGGIGQHGMKTYREEHRPKNATPEARGPVGRKP